MSDNGGYDAGDFGGGGGGGYDEPKRPAGGGASYDKPLDDEIPF